MICDGNIRPGIAVRKEVVLPAFLRGQEQAKIHDAPEPARPGGQRAGPLTVLVVLGLSMAAGFQAARLIDPAEAPPLSLAVHPVEVMALDPAN